MVKETREATIQKTWLKIKGNNPSLHSGLVADIEVIISQFLLLIGDLKKEVGKTTEKSGS
jgi:hypothetical protein